MIEDFTEAFIDDTDIYSNTWIKNLEDLKVVFLALRNANLAARPAEYVSTKQDHVDQPSKSNVRKAERCVIVRISSSKSRLLKFMSFVLYSLVTLCIMFSLCFLFVCW